MDLNIAAGHNKTVMIGITKTTTNNEDKRQRQRQQQRRHDTTRHDHYDYHKEQLQQGATFRDVTTLG